MSFCIERACRSCGSAQLAPILSLGRTPLADRLLTADMLSAPDMTVPLDVVLCRACSLVQITATVDPALLFGGEYPYFSSVSETLLAHARVNAEELMARHDLGPDNLVVEVASNDGYMLRNFTARGIPVLATDVGGVPEALGRAPDGQLPGLLVAPEDPAALAGALRRWLTEPDTRRRLRRAALDRRAGLAGWAATAHTVAEILQPGRTG